MRLTARAAALLAALFFFPSCVSVLSPAEPPQALKPEPEPEIEDCVIVGAGFAGVLANMQSPRRCLMIENGVHQGILRGHNYMLQEWKDVKFIAPTDEPQVSQPHDFREGDTKKHVSVIAFDKARQENIKRFAMKVIRGDISELRVEGDKNQVVRMTVTPPGGTSYEVLAKYVILATGTGDRPKSLDTGQYKSREELQWLRENEVHGIPLVLADTDLMGAYRERPEEEREFPEVSKGFPEAAKMDRWILSGTNAGSATVATFLLDHGVPATKITMLGTKEGLEQLRVFGDNPGEGYSELFLRLDEISFLPGRFKKVEKKDDTLVRVVTEECNMQEGEHFVHAFNMKSDLINIFDQEFVRDQNGRTLQAKPWRKKEGDECRGNGEKLEVDLLGMRMIRYASKEKATKADSEKKVCQKEEVKKEGVIEEPLPIFILGAATTSLPDAFKHATHFCEFEEVSKAEVKKNPRAYTVASMPYMAPKIACAAQLLSKGY